MKGKIFTAQEVQAIISGSKVMFREVIKGAELEISHPAIHSWAQSPNDHKFYAKAKNDEVKQQYVTTFPFYGIKCPYQVGQKIFCKETYEAWDDGLVYKADNSPANIVSKWKPAQHMKQEHSRLTLEITDIRVERLAEISRGDCMAEGCPFPNIAKETNPKEWFKDYWNATHKKLEEKFEASPWVWCVNFNLIKN